MEVTDHVVFFYLHNRGEISDFGRVRHYLQALATKGYYVFLNAEHERLWPLWHEWAVACADGTQMLPPLPPAVSPEVWLEVEHFCAQRQSLLALQGFSVAPQVRSGSGRRLLNGFEWSLGFDEEQGVIFLGYLRQYFTALADEWEAYTHWLEVIQLTSSVWHPIYGYTLDARGGEKETPREQVLANQISYLYDINVFGPQIIEALGRQRVESAPAQLVTPLGDGGIMLVPCENLLPDFSHYSYTQVAQHLGLTAPGLLG